MHPVLRLDAAPAPLEGALVGRRAREQLDRRLYLVFLGERWRDGVALAELGRQAQHLVPGAGAALGAQQHARGGDLLWSHAVEVAQRIARGGEIAVFERELRARGERSAVHALALRVGAVEPAVAALEVAHLVRRARGEQRGERRRRAAVEGERSFLLCARV